ncbi:hypothetical protein QIS74_03220 [Colletotrichum tabaci]|uniref:Uncharacterized protein n=1 Tax=Colletotrichum tabaci TaxID=1209068 RepID=A0AAV9TNF9_9PEZI
MTAPQIFQVNSAPYYCRGGFLLVRRNTGKRRAAADQMNFAAEESAAKGSKVDDE